MQRFKPESDAAGQAAVETVLRTYEFALNASDTDKLLSVLPLTASSWHPTILREWAPV